MANRTVSMFRRLDKKYYPVVFNKNGSIKPGAVYVKGVETKMEGGNFYLSYYKGSQCVRESVGADATYARARHENKLKELRAAADGVTAGFTVVSAKQSANDSGSEEGKTLQGAVNDYLDKVGRRRDAKTFQNYSIVLRLFLESCKRKMVKDVTAEDLQLFADFLRKKGQSKRTVFNRFSVVRSFLDKSGVKFEIDKEDVPKYVAEKPVAYTEDELRTLYAACTPAERLLYRFAAMTGFRLGELQHVEWTDIHPGSKTLTVRSKPHWHWTPKARKERVVPVPSTLINELMAAKPAHGGLIFPGVNGKPEGHMLRKLKEVAERAGLDPKGVWMHKFRATFATVHIQNGVSVPQVGKWMGHADLSATQRYAATVSGAHLDAKIESAWASL